MCVCVCLLKVLTKKVCEIDWYCLCFYMCVECGFFQTSVAYSLSSKRMGLGVFLTCTAWLSTAQLTVDFSRYFSLFLLNRILFIPGTCGSFAVSSWDDVFHLFRVSETKNIEVGRINRLCLLYIKRRKTLYVYEKIKYTALYAPVLF